MRAELLVWNSALLVTFVVIVNYYSDEQRKNPQGISFCCIQWDGVT